MIRYDNGVNLLRKIMAHIRCNFLCDKPIASRRLLILVSLAVILFVGLFIRLSYMSHNLMHTDSYFYVLMAEALANGKTAFPHGFMEVHYYYNIGYPLLIAIAFVLFGFNTQFAIIIPVVLGTLSILLVYLIGEKIFDWRIGLLASLFLAIDPAQITFSGFAMTDTPNQFFLLMGVFFLIKQIREGKMSYAILSGLFFGYSVLVRYTSVLALSPLFLLLLSKKYDRATKKRMVCMIAASLLVFVPLNIGAMIQAKAINYNAQIVNQLYAEDHHDGYESLDIRYPFFGFKPMPNCGLDISCHLSYWSESILNLRPFIARALVSLVIPRIPGLFNDGTYVISLLGFLALFGFIISWKRKELLFPHTFFLSWALAFVGFFLFFYHTSLRYFLPIFPFIYIFSAFFLSYLLSSRDFTLLKIGALYALLSVLVIYTLFRAYDLVLLSYSNPLAKDMISKQMPFIILKILISLLSIFLSLILCLTFKSSIKGVFDRYVGGVTFAIVLIYLVFLLYGSGYVVKCGYYETAKFFSPELFRYPDNPFIEKQLAPKAFFRNATYEYISVSGRPLFVQYYTHRVSIPLYKFDPKEIEAHYPDGIMIVFDPFTFYYYSNYNKTIDNIIAGLSEMDPEKYPVYVTNTSYWNGFVPETIISLDQAPKDRIYQYVYTPELDFYNQPGLAYFLSPSIVRYC